MNTTEVADEPLFGVEVKVVYCEDGYEGPGWYVWEIDAEDEGYVLFSKERPTEDDLKAVCTEYFEVKE